MAWNKATNIKGPAGDSFRILGTYASVSELPSATGGTPVATTTANRTFTASTASFPNPERGWFQYTETHWTNAAGTSHAPLVTADMSAARTGSNTINGATFSHRSIMFRYYVMEYMRNVDTLPAAFLTAVANDFAAARAAGVKLIIRFTYSTDGSNTTNTGPYNTDTTPARTLSHVSQLAATVNSNADVILAVQQGFIGTWGEQYYTDNWGNVGTLTAQNWTDRAALTTALLGWDSRISILLRYPGLKHRYMQGTNLPANAATRLGFHNDAFLADDAGEDWGTYNTFPNGQTVAQLKAYLVAETARPVFMTGETAGVSTSRSLYPNASAEMDTYNWSSLNPNYHPDVLASWSQANKDEVGQKLGYRLRLASATLPTAGSIGGSSSITLSIVNDGWSAPVFPRPIQIVFTNGGTSVTRTLAKDIRTLAQGTNTFTETVALPNSTGTWSMSLSMPDTSLPTRSEYAIRLANTTTYSGVFNDLANSVVLTAPAGSTTVKVGDTYSVASDGHIYTWNGTAWTDAGALRGPAGPVTTFTVSSVTTVSDDSAAPSLPTGMKPLYAYAFAVAGAARPTADTSVSIEWRGPVQPTNALTGDTWVNTSG